MANLLDKTEAALLLSYESVIEKGMDTFLEVGTALKAIADSRLYRSEHKTFDAYLDARWNMTRSWASRLIQAAEVVEALPIGNKRDVKSESQARELAKAPEGKRAETLAKAKDAAAAQGRAQPTAKDIKEAVEQGRGTKPLQDATQHDVERERIPVMDGDDDQQQGEGDEKDRIASRGCGRTALGNEEMRELCDLHPRATGAVYSCPRGGNHQPKVEAGETYCQKCFEPLGEIEAEAEADYDTTSLDEFCQWTIDQCEPQHRDQLAARLAFWTNKAKESL